jgi:hypothetical protein
VRLLTQGMQKTNGLWGKEIESMRDGKTKRVCEMAADAGWIATARTRSLAGEKGSGLGTGCMHDARPKWEWARWTGEDASYGKVKGYGETEGDIEPMNWASPWATRDQVLDG